MSSVGYVRKLPYPGFAGDDGSADPRVSAALLSYRGGGSRVEALSALAASRVLVAVLAVAEDPPPGRPEQRGDTSMAALLLRGRDGRTALLAFTSLAALGSYSTQARPVPLSFRDAAQAALAEGAAALVVDIAGPVALVVEGGDLAHVAAGHRAVDAGTGPAWAVPVGTAEEGGAAAG
jgi:hypothetical protein